MRPNILIHIKQNLKIVLKKIVLLLMHMKHVILLIPHLYHIRVMPLLFNRQVGLGLQVRHRQLEAFLESIDMAECQAERQAERHHDHHRSLFLNFHDQLL
jgi:hypothetical protein